MSDGTPDGWPDERPQPLAKFHVEDGRILYLYQIDFINGEFKFLMTKKDEKWWEYKMWGFGDFREMVREGQLTRGVL